jgi:hypothetical protein
VVLALVPVATAQRIVMKSILDGAQEVPANASPAKGTAFCVLDRTANTLDYALCFTGLGSAETAAHIHGFAAPGVNTGVKHALPLGAFKQGSWSFPETDEAELVAGLAYFNVHSLAFPGGEIRGQIVRSAAHHALTAVADSSQNVPPTVNAAKGVGWFEFDVVLNSFTYSFTMTGLSAAEDASHIHGFAAPGVATSTIKFTLPLGNHKNGTLVFPAAQEANYLAGLAYVNVHIVPDGDDEMRGQMEPRASNPSSYCSSKVNSQGCQALVGWSGLPTLSGADDFHITCAQVINNKSGLLYWGLAPRDVPFFGGTQCVQSPVVRTQLQNSGGNPPPDDCSGTYDFFFSHAYMASVGLTAGQIVHGEYWYRDPADPAHVSLSNAIAAEILP